MLTASRVEKMKQPSEEALRAWVLVLTSVASLMVALDALVVTTALESAEASAQRLSTLFDVQRPSGRAEGGE